MTSGCLSPRSLFPTSQRFPIPLPVMTSLDQSEARITPQMGAIYYLCGILLRTKDKNDHIHKIITYEIYAFLREAPYSFLSVVCERVLSWRYSKKFGSLCLSGIKISVNSKWCFSGLTRKHNKVKVFCYYILSAVPSIHLTPINCSRRWRLPKEYFVLCSKSYL